ncbi:aminotransferase class III-fold pyridoxal phosphate-dependent enzyme [Klebsiella variicola subsp. variicola]|nr:aminotransferase class III-fold pyridoxal phosphate-dependent enzyme [Klebsiella variicola subsp. variicola]
MAFTGAYHGRTHYTLSLTGKVNPYSAGMGLMPGHVYRALYPCALHGVSDDEAIASIHRIFKTMPRRKISPPSLSSRCRVRADSMPPPGLYAAPARPVRRARHYAHRR